MKRFHPSMLLIALLMAFLAGGCGGKPKTSAAHSSKVPAVPVRVHIVDYKSRILTEEIVGTIRAKRRATLEAKVSGRIEKMPVAIGDKLHQGQLIARLEAAEIAARLEQAEASLEQAERDWKRTSALFQEKSATRSEYESAQSRQRVAKGAASEAAALMRDLEITAPFDGVVTRKWADVGDLAMPGKASRED